uniref:melanoma inhibitory activity protein 2-like n=1 Tax=Scatophagus argus TaxID=75038 RepID=UPI001ED7D074
MAVSQVYKVLWGTAIVFVILSHFSLGLLSDYKICGDFACESPVSRVQAIRDHQGKDCRFLSFRTGDTIFVYHKLTGKREDLWAGSIGRQSGYFPKDAVQEEQVHTTTEIVVKTQESDFFCMDEFGYPIDSSLLDSDDDSDDEKTQNQESETTQTTPYTDNTNAESSSASEVDVSTEPLVSAREDDGTSTEEDRSKNVSDAAVGTQEDTQEASATLNEQGGSASSSWLGSSVTGWLGLAKENGPGNLAEGEKKDERKETQAEASLTSSVTRWLGLAGGGKSDDAVKSREDNRETADSFTSTMTGWLGFGGEKKTDVSTDKEQVEERIIDEEQEPAETFRSRRMSLDLEGSQLHEKEKEERGALEWLGNGLSNTLGFGLTSQNPGQETTTEQEAEETIQEEKEQLAASSWLDMGIGDILGYGKDNSEVDESKERGFKESDQDKTLEQRTDSENVDASESQGALPEEVKTETSNDSKMDETLKDQNVPSEMETVPGSTETVTTDSNNRDLPAGTSDSSRDVVLPEDAASKDSQKDISSQNKLEEKFQDEVGMSSLQDSFFHKGSEDEEEDVLDDNKKETNTLDAEISAEMKDEDQQMPKSAENVGEDEKREPEKEEANTASDTDQVFLTQSDINLAPDFSSVDSHSNSSGQSAGEEGQTEDEVEETYNTEESSDTSVKVDASSSDPEGEEINIERGALQRESSSEQSQVSGSAEESSGESQPSLSSGTAEEKNEPASNEDDTLTVHSDGTSVQHLESLTMADNTEAETRQGDSGQEEEGFESSHSTDKSTEISSDDASEQDRRTFYTSGSTTQMEDNADQDSVSPLRQQSDSDPHILNETEKDGNLQPVPTETIRSEKHVLNEKGLNSALGSETETKQAEDSTEDLNQREEEVLKEGEEEVKALEKQEGVEEEKQNDDDLLLKEEERQI